MLFYNFDFVERKRKSSITRETGKHTETTESSGLKDSKIKGKFTAKSGIDSGSYHNLSLNQKPYQFAGS
jgi:hypothetical protein